MDMEIVHWPAILHFTIVNVIHNTKEIIVRQGTFVIRILVTDTEIVHLIHGPEITHVHASRDI
jgi:hypothetical protein